MIHMDEALATGRGLLKSPTGIQGLDEITGGGLPRGRTTLVCGSAGCGKTLFGMEFLVRGATRYDEPGVFMAFEENEKELAKNAASLGFDIDDLVRRKKLVLDYVYIERSEIEEAGEYDLEGIFVRLNSAIQSVGAKRVVIDTIESVFSGLGNVSILRAELRRLFRWLKDKGVTAVITGESGEGALTRHSLEEYVSDCVIVLDHRVAQQTATRRMRIVKYRGSAHGTNEYPFLIDEAGISVLPVTSLSLKHVASKERIPSGIAELDRMLEGKGYYRGSTVLISGTAGTGKTSMAAHFIDAACSRGEKVLYFCFEESESQILRNMLSIGIDLQPWVRKGLLKLSASRPTLCGLEMHLAIAHRFIEEFKPRIVVFDPINAFVIGENEFETKSMVIRLVDYLKARQITAFFTSLTLSGNILERTDLTISSLIDTWILLRDIESSGERNRGLYILKSRGMAHSNQIREFIMTDHGMKLCATYVGAGGVMTGSARLAQEAAESAEALRRKEEVERKKDELRRKKKVLETRIANMRAEFESQEAEAMKEIERENSRIGRLEKDKLEMALKRKAKSNGRNPNRRKPSPERKR